MDDPLSRRVLVLNRLWQPVSIVGVKRAFSLLLQEHAQVIDVAGGTFQLLGTAEWIDFSLQNPPRHAGECVHTVRLALRIPSVLLLRRFDRIPLKEVKFNRRNIFERDAYKCQYCGGQYAEGDLNLDHVIPRDMGGKTSWENIVTSCVRCNSRKANRLPHQAGMHLTRKPSRPRHRTFAHSVPNVDTLPDWNHFMH